MTTKPLASFTDVATGVALSLARARLDDLDGALVEALASMGRFAGVERSYVFTIDRERSVWCYDYEWCAIGVSPQIDEIVDVPLDPFRSWISRFENHEAVHIPEVAALAPSVEREVLESQEILSLIALPMFHASELLGFIGFDSVRGLRTWTPEDRALLQIACDLVGGALSARRFQTALIDANCRLQDTNAQLRDVNEELRTEIHQRRQTEEKLSAEQDKLAAANREIQQLSDLLPICSSCKRIRDDGGQWQQVEAFLKVHSGTEVTHGICPDCATRLYPDYGPFPGARGTTTDGSEPS